MGLIFTLMLVRYLLGLLGLSGLMTSTFWIHRYSNHPIERYNLPPAAHPPLPPVHPLVCAICDITVVVKKLLKIQQC